MFSVLPSQEGDIPYLSRAKPRPAPVARPLTGRSDGYRAASRFRSNPPMARGPCNEFPGWACFVCQLVIGIRRK